MDLALGLRRLEGRWVSLSLADGTRIDECQLVSVAPSGLETVWVYADSEDVFLPLRDIRGAWEARPVPCRAAQRQEGNGADDHDLNRRSHDRRADDRR